MLRITSAQIQTQFTEFIPDVEKRLSTLKIKLTNFTIDHLCFRAKNQNDYLTYFKFFKHHNKLYLTRKFHNRNFHLFILNQPFKYKTHAIPYLEFSEPGGSDQYQTGLQHLELLTNQTWKQIAPKQPQIKKLLYENKHGDEQYLKWPDKIVVKLTKVSLITKMLTANNTQIFLPCLNLSPSSKSPQF